MITIPAFLFQSIPEAIVYTAFTIALAGIKVKDHILKVILTGFLLACIIVVFWFVKIPFFARLLIQMPLFWLVIYYVFRYSFNKVMITATIGFGAILISETISIEILLMIFGLSYTDMMASDLLKIVTPSGGYLVLILATWIMNKYKWSLFRRKEYLEQSDKADKKVDIYILALTIQIILVVVLNLGNVTGLFQQSNLLFQLIIFSIIALSLTLLFFVQYIIRLSEKAGELEAQKDYIKNVNDLFVTIRGQRHDFINHIQVLHSYTKMGKYEQLEKYINSLTDEVKEISRIIVSGNATLSALLQTKSVLFKTYDIDLELSIKSSMDKSEITDLDKVKLIGNLLDNAKEAIIDHDVEKDKRKVTINLYEELGTIQLVVKNMRPVLTEEQMLQIFEVGYTTKIRHTGIGLAIVKQIIDKYEGHINVHSSEAEGTIFTISLPIKKDERMNESNSESFGESHSNEYKGTSIR